jgi:hypothetical protein
MDIGNLAVRARRRSSSAHAAATLAAPDMRLQWPPMRARDSIEWNVPDPVTEAYESGIDLTLIRENLRRSPEERLRALEHLQAFAEELRRGGTEMRRKNRRDE